MGQLYIPKENKIKGPWLIGKEALEELHEIVEKIDGLLISAYDKEIENEAEVDFRKGTYKTIEEALEKTKEYAANRRRTKKIVLVDSDGKKLIDTTILGALKDPLLSGFNPMSLLIKLEYGYSNELTFSVFRRFDGELEYNFKSYDNDVEDEIKYLLENWIEKQKPNKAKQFWSQYYFLFISLTFGMAIFLFFNFALSSVNDPKKLHKQEIETLIKTGINDSNRNKAIEALLKYNIDYVPPDTDRKVTLSLSKVEKRILFLTVCIFIVCLFRPKTTIGIGKQKGLLELYKIYTTVVLVSIPAIFIITPLIDVIKGWFGL